jgi:hypothetical protein
MRDGLWINVLIVALLPMMILISGGSLMADVPGFSIDNSFEREQEYIPGDWNIVDTFSQLYTLDWGETYSSRLAVQMTFMLKMEDIIRSLDVDNKQLTPSYQLGLTGLFYNLDFLVQDTIEYSNEFNIPRKDALEFALDLGLSPLYLPPLQAQFQNLIDTQDNLEDKIERKFDLSTDYSFADFFDMDISWKEEDVDDRLFDDNDISSQEWDFNFNFGQTITPVLKVDFQSGLSGRKQETSNNAGTLLSLEREKDFDAKLKFTLDTFPDFTSDLEVTQTRDLEDNNDEDEIALSALYSQTVMNLGTLTENLKVGRTTATSPTEKTNVNNFGFTIELSGAPYKYVDYSLKYDYSIEDLDDDVITTNSRKTTDQAFDISVTVEPNKKIILDTSFNWSSATVDGLKTGSDKVLKIQGNFDGELLHVPNLTFTPSLEVSSEKNIEDDTDSNVYNLGLNIIYALILPKNISWELETIYNWQRADGTETSDLELGSELDIDLITQPWDFNFTQSSSTTVTFDSSEPASTNQDFTFTASRDLTARIFFDLEYQYQYSSDEDNSDKFETNLEWLGRNSSLALKVTNERVFTNPKDVLRSYGAEFTMEF